MYEYENNCCNNSNNVVKNISRYNMTPFLLFFDQRKKLFKKLQHSLTDSQNYMGYIPYTKSVYIKL